MNSAVRSLAAFSLLAALSTPSAAVPVTFDGLVVSSCLLTIGTAGQLGASSDSARQLGSELTGGTAATLTVVATAGTPTLTVAAPTLSTKPTAYTGSPTVSVRYTSTGGGNQGYTTGSSSYTSSSALGDTLTIHAKAVDNNGFAAGSYRISTTVTCQQ